jgi:hypothetical protein
VIQQSFQELYSAKTDDELLALAADSTSLREDAKSVLAQELQRRNLQRPPSHDKVESRSAGSTPPPRALIFVGALVLNICIALLGTPLLEAGIGKMFHPHSFAALLWKWWALDFLCAAGLGFSISRLWRSKAAAWTWVLPVLWFALRFVPAALSDGNQSVLVGHSVWSRFSGSDCISGLPSLGCRTFFLFTLPLVRGVAYSVGVYTASILTSEAKRVHKSHRYEPLIGDKSITLIDHRPGRGRK